VGEADGEKQVSLAARIRVNSANIDLPAQQLLRRRAYSVAEAMCGRMAAAGMNRSRGGISIHERNRTCHCRQRHEPAAGDRRHVATIASAAIYSFGGSPENWRSLR
jgi:hypothetical protein